MAETSTLLRCEAISWVGDDFPGSIKARLVDADGLAGAEVIVEKQRIHQTRYLGGAIAAAR